MVNISLSQLKGKKKLLLATTLIVISVVFLIIAAILIVPSRNSSKSNSTLELADDSAEALNVAAQEYNLVDNVPSFDLYGEIGNDNEESPAILLRSDFSSDAEPCTSTDFIYLESNRDKCLTLNKEKMTLANHSTVQIYSSYYKEDFNNGSAIYYSSYAILPDGSMVSMTDESKIQFNFYDNETRIVHFNGRGYYRVKKQEDGHKFTIQVGDKIIDISDGEMAIQFNDDKDANDEDWEEMSDLEISMKSGSSLSADLEETKERLSADNYKAGVFLFSGTAKMYTRGNETENTESLNSEENYYQSFKFKDYGNRKSESVSSEELEEDKNNFLDYSPYFTNQSMFSINNYGIGNFNSVTAEDLYNMLMVKFDSVEIFAYNYSVAYKQEMANFNQNWNNFVNKISKCEDGWYKTENGRCCPNDYVYDSSKSTCTKTTYSYYYYCEDGWTLESDNMCHKEGSSSETTEAPSYNPSNGSDDQCYDKSKAATYLLCSMGVDIGSSHMSGSKCCFDYAVEEPELEPVE